MKTTYVKKKITAKVKSGSIDTQNPVKNILGERSCKFGKECAYKLTDHNSSVNVKETITKYSDEISVIQNEMILLKAIIVKMESKINDLNQEIEMAKKTKIEDIVKIVVSMLNSSKSSETSSEVEYKNNTEAQCDQCLYKCENEDLLISHMSKKH